MLKPHFCVVFFFFTLSLLALSSDISADDKKPSDEGFVSLFDGKTLAGWTGAKDAYAVEEGSIVPLNDMAKFRPFWHKVWQGSFTSDFYKVDFEGKYYYALETSREGNAPIETTTTFDPNSVTARCRNRIGVRGTNMATQSNKNIGRAL